ncbi:G patch domain-containing protein 1, partial [Galemys pyrenaicus]
KGLRIHPKLGTTHEARASLRFAEEKERKPFGPPGPPSRGGEARKGAGWRRWAVTATRIWSAMGRAWSHWKKIVLSRLLLSERGTGWAAVSLARGRDRGQHPPITTAQARAWPRARPKKPIPLQDQTVRDEKGRYKRFHGAFSGGFSAGYFNTVGSKEGWTPSTFVSSRQNRADKSVLSPEDFMDEEDLSEFGIAPKAIVTTDDFASKTKDRIREKARQLAAATAPIPGATLLEDFITPAKLSVGFELLRKMGWKEGQGIGPRVKRRPRRQKPDPGVKIYGCALPPGGSEGSEDEDDDYLPENVTFAPKDVTPVDFTPKDNVHGLAYKGLDPHQALFGTSGEHFNLFSGRLEGSSTLLEDIGVNKGRKLGISGQAFGVGALEEEDDDIYATETLAKYDTVLKDEEPGDGLYGWTAPRQYKGQKEPEKDLRYVGKILDGFSLASKPLSSKKTYPPPELPKDYRPVHYFRPMVAATSENSHLHQVLSQSTGKPATDPGTQSRHQLNASKRGELLGETPLQGSATSVLEFLSQKDKERIKEMKQATDLKAAQLKARSLAQKASSSRLQPSSQDVGHSSWHLAWSAGAANTKASNFKPFAKDPEKQKRYEEFLVNMKRGQKDALERCLDRSMTEWERGREREEFARAALLYASSHSTLSARFTHAKEEDDSEQVEVPRDQENDVNDKQSAVKMKMFGKLTRDTFEWHPDKLLCKRFNVPDPYPDSTLVGLPRVKRDKYSVFNFLTLPETASLPTTQASSEKVLQPRGPDKSRKPSRWDTSKQEKKEDSISEFLSLARSKVGPPKQESSPSVNKEEEPGTESPSSKVGNKGVDSQPEGESDSRPSMDLFKAIFASSSDEKSSSSEEEQGASEEEPEHAEEPDSKSAPETSLVETPTVAPTTEPASQEPAPSFPIQKMQIDERAEFGPRLPPKKKHRKHKHKGKQKNKKSEKSSSSESSDSSDSESEEDAPPDLSPQELLRRVIHVLSEWKQELLDLAVYTYVPHILWMRPDVDNCTCSRTCVWGGGGGVLSLGVWLRPLVGDGGGQELRGQWHQGPQPLRTPRLNTSGAQAGAPCPFIPLALTQCLGHVPCRVEQPHLHPFLGRIGGGTLFVLRGNKAARWPGAWVGARGRAWWGRGVSRRGGGCGARGAGGSHSGLTPTSDAAPEMASLPPSTPGSKAPGEDGLSLPDGFQGRRLSPWMGVARGYGAFKFSRMKAFRRQQQQSTLDPLALDKNLPLPEAGSLEREELWGDQEPLSKIPFKILHGHQHIVSSCHFCVNDTKVLSGSYDSTVKLWDAMDGSVVREFKPQPSAPVSECSITADSRRILAASYDKIVQAWDLETGKLLWKINFETFVLTCKFSPDGKYVVSGLDVDRGICITDGESSSTISHIKGHHQKSLTACCFDPDSQRVASVSLDRSVKIWDITSQATVLTITKAHTNAISNCCFTVSVSSVGRGLLSGCSGWLVSAPQRREGHEDWVMDVAVSSDKKWLLSASKALSALKHTMCVSAGGSKIPELAQAEAYTWPGYFHPGSCPGCTLRVWNIEEIDQIPLVIKYRKTLGLKCESCNRPFSIYETDTLSDTVSRCVFCRNDTKNQAARPPSPLEGQDCLTGEQSGSDD